MGKYASIYNAKNPKDPEILIHGFGRMLYSQLKKNVERKLSDLPKFLKDDRFATLSWALDEKSSPLIPFVRALKDIQDEIEELANLTKK